jgi:hypothetical protein
MPTPPAKFGADIYLLKLQRLQNKLLTAGNFPRRASIPRFACGFKNSVRVYDFITKLCRQGAEIILNHENANSSPHGRRRGPNTENIMGLNWSAVMRFDPLCRLYWKC